MTCPGVPDFYQGTELWDFNLVDPDNRRPVDYALRREMLATIKAGVEANAADLRPWLAGLLQGAEDGWVKLFLIWRTLNWRRAHKRLFDGGNYVPLEAQGAKPQHVCAFARAFEGQQAITVVPRRVVSLTEENERLPLGAEIWDTTSLVIPESQPGAEYHNVLTGERLKATEAGLPVAEVFSSFPVALLERIPG